MSMKKLGIAVIGSGRAGMIHARNFARGVHGAELVAMVDPVEEAVKAACEELEIDTSYLSYSDALKDDRIDAVVVVTPTVYHRDIVVAAAEAGKHVLCEKPMAMNVPECVEMNRAVEKAGVKLQIGFMRRFDRNFIQAKEFIDAGEIGEVVMVKSLTHGPSKPQPWMFDIRKSNGPLAEVNSHDIDNLRWFVGSEFERVYAIAGNFRNPEVKGEYPDFYDNVIMNIGFEDGKQGVIDGAVYVQYGYDARVEVLGTEGILFVGQLEDGNSLYCRAGNRMIRPSVVTWRRLFIDAYEAEDRAFIESIIDNTEPKVTGLDGMMAVKAVNAGNRSIIEKRPVMMNEDL
jgi:myo-inositol 2-dehydrogenase/D-chiro-inositol 1-dehydrogenase/scyllo-inositol 2-dehydrogenase (NAD+)